MKEIKKAVNKVASAALIYQGIMIVVLLATMFLSTIVFTINNWDVANFQNHLEDYILKLQESGTGFLVAIVLGMGFFFLYFHKEEARKQIFVSAKKMTPKHFVMMLFLFMLGQLLFSGVGAGVEAGFNLFGLTVMNQIEAASHTSSTVSMFLYAAIFGPITEELVFRGFFLRRLLPYGRIYAIVISALLFGAFHGNLVQGIFAFFVGLILGYVALEYSIYWSVALHMINNMIFGDLLSYLISPLSSTWQDAIQYSVEGFFCVGAVLILFRKRKVIRAYLQKNRIQKGYLKATFQSVCMIVFLITMFLLSLLGVEKM